MNKIARIVASKWFAGPLCALPLFFLAWDYFQALKQLEQEAGTSIRQVSDANRTSGSLVTTSVEYADFSFSVSDEEFHEYTGGTFRATEENSTEKKRRRG